MWRKQFGSAASRALSLVVLTVTLASGAAASGNYKVLHSFDCATDGCGPTGDLIFDAQGNLYGSASDTVFEMKPSSGGPWTLTALHFFNILSQGESLWAGVTMDLSGNLYGTAVGGGTYDLGTVFELTPSADGWTLDVLHSFSGGNDGDSPFAPAALDKLGNVYGTTQGSTVFELSPSSRGDWTETIIDDFKAKGDGNQPEAGLIWDHAGNLYGTTRFGGLVTKGCEGCGTVFELSPISGGWKEHVLYRFKWVPGGRDGQAPYASVVFDPSGNLYGTTAGGGSDNTCGGGCGTVFKLTPSKNGHWTESVIHSFSAGKGGNASFARVVLDKAGNLYGTTQRGGIGTCEGGCGVVFKLAPGSNGKWIYSVLHRFTGPDGATPNAGLTLDQSGKHLYGTTTLGGANGAGTVFEITP